MIPMHDLDKTHQTLIGEIEEKDQYGLGFDVPYLSRLCWRGLTSLSRRTMRSLLEEQRSRRRAMKNRFDQP